MSTLLDYLGSAIIFGILIITVIRVQTNISSIQTEMRSVIDSQTYAVDFVKQLEFDFNKIGHEVSTQKILIAHSDRIRFRSDLLNNGTVRTIEYRLGTPSDAAGTTNPNDIPIYRREDASEIIQIIGLTQFAIEYFDSLNVAMPAPITTADSLNRIRAMRVSFKIESMEPPITRAEEDTTYPAVVMERFIIPRNLSRW